MVIKLERGQNARLGQHFEQREFDCKCAWDSSCRTTYVDIEGIFGLERLREKLGKPIKIMSGFRCTAHNEAVGGKPGSYHPTGKAFDIEVEGMTGAEIAEKAADGVFGDGGIGLYENFPNLCHVDVRGYRARWGGA